MFTAPGSPQINVLCPHCLPWIQNITAGITFHTRLSAIVLLQQTPIACLISFVSHLYICVCVKKHSHIKATEHHQVSEGLLLSVQPQTSHPVHNSQYNVPGPVGLERIHPLAESSWTFQVQLWRLLLWVRLFLQLAAVPSKPGAGGMPHTAACCSAPRSAVSPSNGLALP